MASLGGSSNSVYLEPVFAIDRVNYEGVGKDDANAGIIIVNTGKKIVDISFSQNLGINKQKVNKIVEDYKKPIVTEVKKFEHFYEAEDYHHNYFANNPSNPYCSMVIKPEVNDFIMRHGNVLKAVKH